MVKKGPLTDREARFLDGEGEELETLGAFPVYADECLFRVLLLCF